MMFEQSTVYRTIRLIKLYLHTLLTIFLAFIGGLVGANTPLSTPISGKSCGARTFGLIIVNKISISIMEKCKILVLMLEKLVYFCELCRKIIFLGGKMLKKKWNITGAIFLFALYFAYQVSITAFTHVHMVHGMMIVHSHPSKDLQNHNHTNEQIVSIALLSTIQTEEPEIASFDLATPILLGTLSFCHNTFHVLTDYTHGIKLRGPPIF